MCAHISSIFVVITGNVSALLMRAKRFSQRQEIIINDIVCKCLGVVFVLQGQLVLASFVVVISFSSVVVAIAVSSSSVIGSSDCFGVSSQVVVVSGVGRGLGRISF